MDQRRGLQSTRWTLVLRAGGARTPESRAALEELCALYRPPLLAFARHLTRDAEQAEDLVQSFLLDFVEKDMVARAREDRGSFRALLRASLRNHLLTRRKADGAQKRGGGVMHVDADDVPLRDGRSADVLFDGLCARALVDRVLVRLGEEEARAGRGARHEALRGRLGDGAADAPPLRETAALLGMNEGAVKVALDRLRKRYAARLRAEVAETVSRPEDVEAELRDLLAALRPPD